MSVSCDWKSWEDEKPPEAEVSLCQSGEDIWGSKNWKWNLVVSYGGSSFCTEFTEATHFVSYCCGDLPLFELIIYEYLCYFLKHVFSISIHKYYPDPSSLQNGRSCLHQRDPAERMASDKNVQKSRQRRWPIFGSALWMWHDVAIYLLGIWWNVILYRVEWCLALCINYFWRGIPTEAFTF